MAGERQSMAARWRHDLVRACGGEAPPRTAARGHGVETETCVIGGGLAGLGTALSLAERGQPSSCSRPAGSAPAPRAAMAAWSRPASTAASPSSLAAAGPARCRDALPAEPRRAWRCCAAASSGSGIACGLVEGVIEAVLVRRPRRRSAHEVERLSGLGRPARALAGRAAARGLPLDAVSRRIPRPRRLPSRPAGPLPRARRPRQRAGRRAFYEDTPVLRLERAGERLAAWRRRTGQVLARQVVLCTSAGRPALAPALAPSHLARA